MFVSLKRRLSSWLSWQRVTRALLIVMVVVVAWEAVRAPFSDHFDEKEFSSVVQSIDSASDPEPLLTGTYYLKRNWPFSGMGDTFSSIQNDQMICVIVIACSDSGEVLKQYALFAENAAQKGYPLQSEYDAVGLEHWRENAVSNACFINTWPAYIAGALLYFAFDDGNGDISTYNAVIAETCPASEVFDHPQP